MKGPWPTATSGDGHCSIYLHPDGGVVLTGAVHEEIYIEQHNLAWLIEQLSPDGVTGGDE